MKFVERHPISEIKEWDRNPKIHAPEQVRKLKRTIDRLGWGAPVLVQAGTGRLIAGHGRIKAARELGLEEVPAVFLDLGDAEADQMAIGDNALAELSKWDEAEIRKMAVKFRESDVDVSDLHLDRWVGETGWPTRERGEWSEVGGDSAEVGERRTVVSKAGDVWLLDGDRIRIACGDCRRSDVVAAAAGHGGPIELVVSDPPYCSGGSQEAQKSVGSWGSIAADNLSTRGYKALLSDCLAACRAQTAYLFTDWRMWVNLLDVVEAGGLAVRQMIVWDKMAPGMGALWRTQHELVMFAARGSMKRRKGEAGLGNVLAHRRTNNRNHFTEKPVGLMQEIIENDARCEKRSDDCLVFDPFAGSGSTLVACSRLGRRGAGVEVEPIFVDMAVRRILEEVGEGAVATLEATGQSFEEVEEERQG